MLKIIGSVVKVTHRAGHRLFPTFEADRGMVISQNIRVGSNVCCLPKITGFCRFSMSHRQNSTSSPYKKRRVLNFGGALWPTNLRRERKRKRKRRESIENGRKGKERRKKGRRDQEQKAETKRKERGRKRLQRLLFPKRTEGRTGIQPWSSASFGTNWSCSGIAVGGAFKVVKTSRRCRNYRYCPVSFFIGALSLHRFSLALSRHQVSTPIRVLNLKSSILIHLVFHTDQLLHGPSLCLGLGKGCMPGVAGSTPKDQRIW